MKHNLSALLDTHGTSLHALLWRLTLRHDAAEDLLQELFVKLATSPQFHAATDPAAYLKRAAINLALDWRRALKRGATFSDLPFDAAADDPSPLDAVADADEFARILDASSRLAELSRQAFVMRYVQEESFESIAAALGKTPHQARGLCHHAVTQVRRLLAPGDATDPANNPSPEVTRD